MKKVASQIITLGGDQYAIPQDNLQELVRIPAAEVKHKIDRIGDIPVVKLRKGFIPLIGLADVLGVKKTYAPAQNEVREDRRLDIADRRSFRHGAPDPYESPEGGKPSFVKRQERDRRTSPASAVNIAIVFSGEHKYGLVVDKFNDSEEIAVHPPGAFLTGCTAFMGTTILGSEAPGLVLDILNIAQTRGLSATGDMVNEAVSGLVQKEQEGERLSLLTFRNSDTEYFAIDLDAVERLERFNSNDFEQIGGEEVVQYRGAALRLVELSRVLNCSPFNPEPQQEVIVLRDKGTLFGLKAVPPVDTVECRAVLDRTSFNEPPVSGSLILNKKTTLLVDVSKLAEILRASPGA